MGAVGQAGLEASSELLGVFDRLVSVGPGCMRLCGRVRNLPCIRREIDYVSPPAPLREQAGAFSRHGDHQFPGHCPGAMLRLQTHAVRGLLGPGAGSEGAPCVWHGP